MALPMSSKLALITSMGATNVLCHHRMGHLNYWSLHFLCSKKMVEGFPSTIKFPSDVCENCQLNKHHKDSFKNKKVHHASGLLELVHLDSCGPMAAPSHGDVEYVITFIGGF